MFTLRANEITSDYFDGFCAHYLFGRQLDLLWPDSATGLETQRQLNYPEVNLRVYGN